MVISTCGAELLKHVGFFLPQFAYLKEFPPFISDLYHQEIEGLAKGLDDIAFFSEEVQHEIYARIYQDIHGVSYSQAVKHFKGVLQAESDAIREAVIALGKPDEQ